MSPSSAAFAKAMKLYWELWNIGGTKVNKKAGLEHLDILKDGLAMTDFEEGKSLRGNW